MPFRYRLQKVLEFRIRKKEEQLNIVQKAQQAVFIAEENIRKNEEEIRTTKLNIAEEKAAELKQYSELGVTRFFRQSQEKLEEEEEILKKLEDIDGGSY